MYSTVNFFGVFYVVLFNIITFRRSLEDAIEWPRLHHQLLPMELEVEGRLQNLPRKTFPNKLVT